MSIPAAKVPRLNSLPEIYHHAREAWGYTDIDFAVNQLANDLLDLQQTNAPIENQNQIILEMMRHLEIKNTELNDSFLKRSPSKAADDSKKNAYVNFLSSLAYGVSTKQPSKTPPAVKKTTAFSMTEWQPNIHRAGVAHPEFAFKNNGTECFINAVLKAIFTFNDLRILGRKLQKREDETDIEFKERKDLQINLTNLLLEYRRAPVDENANKNMNYWRSRIVTSPIWKRGNINLDPARQQDAHEFLIKLYELLEVDQICGFKLIEQHYKYDALKHEFHPANPIAPKTIENAKLTSFLNGGNAGVTGDFADIAQSWQQCSKLGLEGIDPEDMDYYMLMKIFVADDEFGNQDPNYFTLLLPRYDANDPDRKNNAKIEHFWETVAVPCYTSNNEEGTLHLTPVSYVCHRGDSAKSGHYVAIKYQPGSTEHYGYYEMHNDSHISFYFEDNPVAIHEVKDYIASSCYMIHYKVDFTI